MIDKESSERNFRRQGIAILADLLLDGARVGLSRFNRQSVATALIYRPDKEMDFCVVDPSGLLRDYKEDVRRVVRCDSVTAVLEEAVAEAPADFLGRPTRLGTILTLPELDSLLHFGIKSDDEFLQIWFAQKPLGVKFDEQSRMWLSLASRLFYQGKNAIPAFDNRASRYWLESCAPQVIEDFVRELYRTKRAGSGPSLWVTDLLNTVASVSITLEENENPDGQIAFVEPEFLGALDFLRFSPSVSIKEHKHVRKLLQAAVSQDYSLVSDSTNILGVSTKAPPGNALVVTFRAGTGNLTLDGKRFAACRHGQFYAASAEEDKSLNQALDSIKLSERAFVEPVYRLINKARKQFHGCSIVVNLDQIDVQHAAIQGHTIESPLDLTDTLNLDLASNLSRVDGALHLDRNGKLLSFGCLLSGNGTAELSRGARYNSGKWYSASHVNSIVIVVSEDGPVTIFHGGVILNTPKSYPQRDRVEVVLPTIDSWLADG